MIPQMLAELSAEARIVLANALYFKRWQQTQHRHEGGARYAAQMRAFAFNIRRDKCAGTASRGRTNCPKTACRRSRWDAATPPEALKSTPRGALASPRISLLTQRRILVNPLLTIWWRAASCCEKSIRRHVHIVAHGLEYSGYRVAKGAAARGSA
jgi:hypothetical protein